MMNLLKMTFITYILLSLFGFILVIYRTELGTSAILILPMLIGAMGAAITLNVIGVMKEHVRKYHQSKE